MKLIILAILENDLRISTDTMLCIIAKHLPVKLADEAERRFWQSKCQQLMASIRDQDGVRMVFHTLIFVLPYLLKRLNSAVQLCG